MYRTFVAGSPCLKTVSLLPYSTTFLAAPAESRKAWASKACFALSLNVVFVRLRSGTVACIVFTPADFGWISIELNITTSSEAASMFRVQAYSTISRARCTVTDVTKSRDERRAVTSAAIRLGARPKFAILLGLRKLRD